MNDRTAAIIAEPIRGEGGVRSLPRAFSDAIMDVCRRTGTLLIADEVQMALDEPDIRSIHRHSAGSRI